MKTALIQMDIALGDVSANRKKAVTMIDEGLSQGAKLFVLPEMWTTGYQLTEISRLGEPTEGPTITLLQAIAQKHQIEIITGSIAELHNNKVYNTAYAINQQGKIVAKYRKMHLIGLMEEDKFLLAGTEKCIFEMSFGTAGIIICYDLRFLELPRALALGGCQTLFVPAEWPTSRGKHWTTLNLARAIENQMFVIAVNAVGKNSNNTFYGHSMIVSPWGDIVAEGPVEEEAVVVADVNFAMVAEVRQKMPVFKDRCPQFY